MNLPADFQRLLPIVGVAVIALGAVVLVARGLGGGATASAQQVLDRALKVEPESGAITGRVSFALENGQTGRGATLVDSIFSGAGSGSGKDEQGRLHMVEKVLGKEPVVLDEVAVRGRGYIRVDGRWYRLSDGQFKRVFEPDKDESLVESLGFDPRKWMRDPKLEGTARVGGVEANHITGEVDAETAINDMGGFETERGDSAEERRFVELLRSSTKRGTMDVFAGKQDGILRKLSVTIQMDAPQGGPPLRSTFTFALGLDKVNQPVQIDEPENALPSSRIAEIPRAKLGDEADDILGPTAKPSPERGEARKGRGGSGRSGRRPRASAQGYVSCVQSARDLRALERCQALLP